MSAAIADLDQTFTKRMVFTIMHETQSALIMLRKGGKPKGDEDFDEMEAYEKNAVTAFKDFAEVMRFK